MIEKGKDKSGEATYYESFEDYFKEFFKVYKIDFCLDHIEKFKALYALGVHPITVVHYGYLKYNFHSRLKEVKA